MMVACDKEVEVDASHKTFGVIGVRVAPSVVHILMSQVDIEVDDLEWVVARMKAESAAELPSKAAGITIYSFILIVFSFRIETFCAHLDFEIYILLLVKKLHI